MKLVTSTLLSSCRTCGWLRTCVEFVVDLERVIVHENTSSECVHLVACHKCRNDGRRESPMWLHGVGGTRQGILPRVADHEFIDIAKRAAREY